MTSMNVNPQPDLLPAAPFSDMEKSRPPTEIFLYPYLVIGNCLFIETVVKGTAVKKKLCNFSAWIIGEVTMIWQQLIQSFYWNGIMRRMSMYSPLQCPEIPCDP